MDIHIKKIPIACIISQEGNILAERAAENIRNNILYRNGIVLNAINSANILILVEESIPKDFEITDFDKVILLTGEVDEPSIIQNTWIYPLYDGIAKIFTP